MTLSIVSTVSKDLLDFIQEQAGVDVYEKKNQPSNATGGVQLGPEAAAFAAVQRAAALAGPSMIHCDLCNVRRLAAAIACCATGLTCRHTGNITSVQALPRCIDRIFVPLQANFAGDAQYKQHLEGPIHRKAMAKAEAQRQRDLQLGASKGAAESALVRAFVTGAIIPQ